MKGRKILGGLVVMVLFAAIIVLALLVGIWVFGIVAALLVWWGCIYVAFSRTTLRTIMRIDEEGRNTRLEVIAWKYPDLRNWALIGAVILPLLIAAIPFAIMLRTDSAVPLSISHPTAVPDATQAGLALTSTSQPLIETPNPTPSATHEPPTETPSQTPTQPSSTPTLAPPTMTPSFTPMQPSPTAKPPTQTPTATPSRTPSPTPTEPTPTVTHTRTPTVPPPSETPEPSVIQPELLAPLPGREYKNPVAFNWDGALLFGQSYLVTAYHVVSGDRVQSELLTQEEWAVNLPAERFGEWRWRVEVISLGSTVTASSEQMFWFNPLPGTRRPTPTPTRTPTGARTP